MIDSIAGAELGGLGNTEKKEVNTEEVELSFYHNAR